MDVAKQRNGSFPSEIDGVSIIFSSEDEQFLGNETAVFISSCTFPAYGSVFCPEQVDARGYLLSVYHKTTLVGEYKVRMTSHNTGKLRWFAKRRLIYTIHRAAYLAR